MGNLIRVHLPKTLPPLTEAEKQEANETRAEMPKDVK